MSWQKYFKTSLVDACEPPENHGRFAFSNGQRHPEDSGKAISLLLEKIGNRDVVVDACLPPQLAHDLRSNNVNAIWVPAILGDGASDGEIVRELLLEDKGIWGSSTNQKVLLTRDVEFYKRIQKKAILVNHSLAKHFRRDGTQQMDQRNLKISMRR